MNNWMTMITFSANCLQMIFSYAFLLVHEFYCPTECFLDRHFTQGGDFQDIQDSPTEVHILSGVLALFAYMDSCNLYTIEKL